MTTAMPSRRRSSANSLTLAGCWNKAQSSRFWVECNRSSYPGPGITGNNRVFRQIHSGMNGIQRYLLKIRLSKKGYTSPSWLIRPFGLSPPPARHRLRVIQWIFGKLRVDHGDSRTPLDIPYQRGTKFRIGGNTQFIGSIEKQLYPAFSLFIIQHFTDVMTDHDRMTAAILLCIFLRSDK